MIAASFRSGRLTEVQLLKKCEEEYFVKHLEQMVEMKELKVEAMVEAKVEVDDSLPSTCSFTCFNAVLCWISVTGVVATEAQAA
jgi:hypothetical protein